MDVRIDKNPGYNEFRVTISGATAKNILTIIHALEETEGRWDEVYRAFDEAGKCLNERERLARGDTIVIDVLTNP